MNSKTMTTCKFRISLQDTFIVDSAFFWFSPISVKITENASYSHTARSSECLILNNFYSINNGPLYPSLQIIFCNIRIFEQAIEQASEFESNKQPSYITNNNLLPISYPVNMPTGYPKTPEQRARDKREKARRREEREANTRARKEEDRKRKERRERDEGIKEEPYEDRTAPTVQGGTFYAGTTEDISVVKKKRGSPPPMTPPETRVSPPPDSPPRYICSYCQHRYYLESDAENCLVHHGQQQQQPKPRYRYWSSSGCSWHTYHFLEANLAGLS